MTFPKEILSDNGIIIISGAALVTSKNGNSKSGTVYLYGGQFSYNLQTNLINDIKTNLVSVLIIGLIGLSAIVGYSFILKRKYKVQ